MTIDRARFRRPVVPGDTMYVKVRKIRNRGNVWKFHADVLVGEHLAAEADFAAMLMDR